MKAPMRTKWKNERTRWREFFSGDFPDVATF
jgi:hypothetical protein